MKSEIDAILKEYNTREKQIEQLKKFALNKGINYKSVIATAIHRPNYIKPINIKKRPFTRDELTTEICAILGVDFDRGLSKSTIKALTLVLEKLRNV